MASPQYTPWQFTSVFCRRVDAHAALVAVCLAVVVFCFLFLCPCFSSVAPSLSLCPSLSLWLFSSSFTLSFSLLLPFLPLSLYRPLSQHGGSFRQVAEADADCASASGCQDWRVLGQRFEPCYVFCRFYPLLASWWNRFISWSKVER